MSWFLLTMNATTVSFSGAVPKLSIVQHLSVSKGCHEMSERCQPMQDHKSMVTKGLEYSGGSLGVPRGLSDYV